MRKHSIQSAFGAALLAGVVHAQVGVGDQPGQPRDTVSTLPSPAPAPPYRLYRYDQDYRYLADPSRRISAIDGLKYIPLNDSDPDTYLSLSGESRTRYEYTRNPGFGLQGVRHNDYVLQRFLLGADLHVTKHFR